MWGFRYVQYVRSTVLCRIFIFPLFRSTSYHMLHSSHFARTTNGGAEARDRGRGYIWQHKWHTYRVTCGAANANHIYYSRHKHISQSLELEYKANPFHHCIQCIVLLLLAHSFVHSTLRFAHTHCFTLHWKTDEMLLKFIKSMTFFSSSSIPRCPFADTGGTGMKREERDEWARATWIALLLRWIELNTFLFVIRTICCYSIWIDDVIDTIRLVHVVARARSLIRPFYLYIYSLNLKRIIYALRADFSIISIANSGWSNRRKLTTRE